ncbi:MAG TPA: GNAT family N-acetyltransferase [Azospirillaceae bacterium]|nr:GNAT family N-acetyltransferase [Azospirillaceae bacterium]
MSDGPVVAQPACRLRAAAPDDAAALAELVVLAGGGVYEFQLDGLFGDAALTDVLASGICGVAGNFSYRHMFVAEDAASGAVAGMAHGYPTEWMRTLDRSFIPPDRLAHLAPFADLQDWDSYFVSALAVSPAWRRRGLGAALLEALAAKARSGGFPRLSLHVWADNAAALAFYAAVGFFEAGRADMPPHPRLPHVGGSVLLVRAL